MFFCYHKLHYVFMITGLLVIAVIAKDSTDLVELQPMTVTRQRIIEYDCLDSSLIYRASESNSIDGLLTNVAGIDVKRSSPFSGKGKSVTLRGFDESRFLILLDGRQLNGSGVMGGDYVDWSSLSTDNIQKIEVIRGTKSAEFGNTFGGVINIVTRTGKDLPEKTSVSVSYGVFSPEHSQDIYEKRKTNVSLAHRSHIGNFATIDLYVSHAEGKPFLRNNYHESTNFGGNLSLHLPLDIEFAAGLRTAIQDRGFAIENHSGNTDYKKNYPESNGSAGGGPGIAWKGGEFYFGDRSYWKNIRTQTDFSLSKMFDNVNLTGRIFLNDQNRTEYFYAITDTSNLVLERFAKPEDNTWGWNIKADQNLGKGNTVKYGMEGLSLQYNNTDIRHVDTSYFLSLPSDGSQKTIRASNLYSAYLQSELSLMERLELTPGVRYDYYFGNKRDSTVDETRLQGISPNAGVTLKTWKGAVVSINGSYRYRFPSCPELYWYYDGHSFIGRKELSPERARQLDIGFSQELPEKGAFKGTFRIEGYHYIVNDYIRTVFGGRPVAPVQPKASRLIYNIDKVKFTGFELETKIALFDNLNLQANYTYQITHKTGDLYDSSTIYSNRLPELPEHKANAGMDYTFNNGLSAGVAMRFVGEREVIQESFSISGAGYKKVDAFMTMRLYGTYPVYSSDAFAARIRFGIDNLFNSDYEEEPGIAMPGITTTGAVEIIF